MSNSSLNTNVESLWEQFGKPLLSYIKHRVNNEQDAEDVLQNVFCKIINGLDSLREDEKIHVWVYTIARNAITDYFRTQKYVINNVELTEDIPDKSLDVDVITANEEISECIRIMVKYLPDKYKEAIVLTEFDNLTQKELSMKLGITVSGAKSRVQRARARLKDMLVNCCNFDVDT